MTQGKTLLRRTAIAFLLSTLLFSRRFAMTFDERNRFFMHWGRRDALALLAVVTLLALLILGMRFLMDLVKSQRARRLYEHAFLIALVCGLLTLYPFPWRPNVWISAIWLPIMAVIGYSYGSSGSRLVGFGRGLALVLSPVVPILFLQICMLPTWDAPQKRPARLAGTGAAKSPVYFFLFDGWSYNRSTEAGEFLPHLENLRRLESTAFVFREAHSPGVNTIESIPGIIHQADMEPAGKNEIFGPWIRGEKEGERPPSIFGMARRHGYATGLIGVYYPYARIFGRELDSCYARAYGRLGDDFPGKMLEAVVGNLLCLNDPISQHLGVRVARRFYRRNHYEEARRFFDETLSLLGRRSTNILAFFHLPFPHWPYVFRADGTYAGHGDDDRGRYDAEAYLQQLAYLDVVVGEILRRLRESGKFDESLLILTADHSSPFDPPSRAERTHVPLLIKMPGQETSHVIDAPVRNNRLGPIIEAVLRGDADGLDIPAVLGAPSGSG